MTEKKDYVKILMFKQILKSPRQIANMERAFGPGGGRYNNYPLDRGKGKKMSKLVNSPERLAEWTWENYGEGKFYALPWGWSRRKNKKKCAIAFRLALFKIELWRLGNSYDYIITSLKGLRSYGFWRNPLESMENFEFYEDTLNFLPDADYY